MSMYNILDYEHCWSSDYLDDKSVTHELINASNERKEEDKFKLDLFGMKAVITNTTEQFKDFYPIIDPQTLDISGSKLKLKLKLKGDKCLNIANRE